MQAIAAGSVLQFRSLGTRPSLACKSFLNRYNQDKLMQYFASKSQKKSESVIRIFLCLLNKLILNQNL